MKNNIVTIFLLLWAVTATSLLTIVFWGGHSFSSYKARESGQASTDTPILSENVFANGDSELLKLKKENSDLQKMLKALQDEVSILKLAKPANMYHDSAKEPVETLWNNEFSSYYYKWNKKFLEGLDIVLELVLDFSAAGDAGIDTLIKVAMDEQRVKEERAMAWDIMYYIPNKKALDTIMTFLPDEDRDQMVGRLWRQVKKLPTIDVAEYIPELNNLIYEKCSSESPLDDDEIKTLSFLALKHESYESLNILNDSGVCDKSDTPLIIADYLHTDSTRNFIEEIYSDHPKESYREEAREKLYYWKRQ